MTAISPANLSPSLTVSEATKAANPVIARFGQRPNRGQSKIKQSRHTEPLSEVSKK